MPGEWYAQATLLVQGWLGTSLLSLCLGIDVSDSFVAHAGSCYEAFMVENGDGAVAVADELAFPQDAHCRVTPSRRTPSMSARNSCVMRNSLELTRSRVIKIQRAMRCVTTWKRLHAAVCAIWIISK